MLSFCVTASKVKERKNEQTDGLTCRQVALVIVRFGVGNSCTFFYKGTVKAFFNIGNYIEKSQS
jgi:hypothetical protein